MNMKEEEEKKNLYKIFCSFIKLSCSEKVLWKIFDFFFLFVSNKQVSFYWAEAKRMEFV
jgi:hypothetical protein